MPLEFNKSPAAPQMAGATEPSIASRALAFAHRRPLLWAVVVVLAFMLLGILVFRPSYETNDDPAMSFIVSGQVFGRQPDEHMVFTHFVVGLVLQRLYLLAPSIPWYAIYLFAVHAAAHSALVYLLFKQRLAAKWLAIYLIYAGVAGLMFLGALQFTTTAFLAAQSGLCLGLFAFCRAADGDSRLARRTAIAGAAFLIAAALIRWHVFMLFFSLALPAAGVLVYWHRSQSRLIFKAAGLTALLMAGLVGLSLANSAYYARDPRWSDFYSYNELRARVNDLGWVYYSPETAHVFPQVGWSLNDFAMIQAWFFDDPAVYGAPKLQELLDAYPWHAPAARDGRILDLLAALADEPQIMLLLALLPLSFLVLGRNDAGQLALLLTCVWVCGLLCVATVLRKPPPPRVFLPMLSFPAALALVLGAALPTRSAGRDRIPPPGPLAPPRRTPSKTLRRALQVACVGLAAIAVVDGLGLHYARGRRNHEASEAFYSELSSIAREPNRLYIAWGASVPIELLRPTDSLQWLSNLRLLHWGWPQQCPFHGEMKLVFGLNDLARELADRPDITLISDPDCLPLLATYIREHHGREVTFEPTGRFLTAVVTRALPAPSAAIASQESPRRQ